MSNESKRRRVDPPAREAPSVDVDDDVSPGDVLRLLLARFEKQEEKLERVREETWRRGGAHGDAEGARRAHRCRQIHEPDVRRQRAARERGLLARHGRSDARRPFPGELRVAQGVESRVFAAGLALTQT